MRSVVSCVAVLLGGWVAVSAEPPNGVAALEQKLVGAWKGQTPCAGNLRFRADGTYEWTNYGPAPYDSAGTWKMRWDALPPTLVLTCKTSEIEDERGKIREIKIAQLDNQTISFKTTSPDLSRYGRSTGP